MENSIAFEIARKSVEASFKDAGDFNLGATQEDMQEVELHVLANLAQAFGVIDG